MRIHIHFMPEEIIDQYNLRPLMHNDWLYLKISKGMYGLKQAGYLANQNIQQHIKKYGYLLNARCDRYTIAVDATDSHYCGFTLNWDYTNCTLEISMRNYIPNLLAQLQIESTKTEHAPHEQSLPIYGKHVQYQTDEPDLPVLPKQEITKIQQVVGSLLYYVCAVDPTLLAALASITSE